MLITSPKNLALLVNSRRKQLKLNQTEIADLVGLKQKTISAFENKPETIKFETLFRILSAARLDIIILPKEHAGITETPWKEEW